MSLQGRRANWPIGRGNGMPRTAGRGFTRGRPIDLELAGEQLRVGGTEFASKQLHDQFAAAQAHSGGAGRGERRQGMRRKARQLWREAKTGRIFLSWKYIGSAVVEHLVTIASGRICGWADQNGMAVLPHYSPGYSGWDISDQIKLWNLIRQKRARDFPGEFTCWTAGCCSRRNRCWECSASRGIWTRSRNLATLIPCENCSLPGLPVSPRRRIGIRRRKSKTCAPWSRR